LSHPKVELRKEVREILASCGLSLTQLSRQSRALFPSDQRYHLSHSFYHRLRVPGFTPSVYQLSTLSVLSNYRLEDWLKLFSFHLDDIPRFQAILPTKRTVLIDPNIYDAQEWVGWFSEIDIEFVAGQVAPLGQWVRRGPSLRTSSLRGNSGRRFRYAKIGWEDAYAFPELLPGSIVRIDPMGATSAGLAAPIESTRQLFLVEHGAGLTCSRLEPAGQNRVALCPTFLPYAPVELELGRDARIIGIVDAELRSLTNTPRPHVPPELGRFWTPPPLEAIREPRTFGAFLRRARERCDLSFREASEKSRQLAKRLRDDNYFCAISTLSDYETRTRAPRHVQKLISLCVMYALSAWELMTAAGLPFKADSQRIMPDGFLRRPTPGTALLSMPTPRGFLKRAVEEFDDMPMFLGSVMATLSDVSDLSLRDTFWLGDRQLGAHKYLNGALFAIVNRRKKKPRPSPGCPLWAQPLYILLKRDGSYFCAACTLEDGTLVARPYSSDDVRTLHLRNHVDAEVIGKTVAVVRRLLRSTEVSKS